MVLVDTSVWIGHLSKGELKLSTLLEEGQILTHPFVIGELACGNLRNRAEILGLLDALPKAQAADHEEALAMLHGRRLFGQGLGWVDLHILASALLSEASLWTLDAHLRKAASALNLSHV